MKQSRIISMCVAMLTWSVALPAMAGWTQTNGPHAGWEQSVVAGGNYFFCATNSGVCRSSDKGENWNLILTMPSSSVVVHDSTVFAGGYFNNMMLRSTDLGDHWSVVTSAGFDHFVTLIYSGSVLLAGGEYGINRSTDEGMTWTSSDSPAPRWVDAFFTKGNVIYAQSWMMGDYRSTDSGRSWRLMVTPLPNDGLLAMMTDGKNLYAPRQKYLYRSSNDGAQWTIVDSGTYGNIYTVLAVDNIVCAAGKGGWYRSVDGGVTCSRISIGLESSTVWSMVNVHGVFFAETSCGIFRSPDSGATWSFVDCNPGFAGISSIVGNGNVLFTGTTRGVFTSTNNGSTWSPVNLGITLDAPISFMGIQQGSVFAYADDIGGSPSQGKLYRSTDRGHHWTDGGIGGWEAYTVTCMASDSILLVVGSNVGVQPSFDSGMNWKWSLMPNEEIKTIGVEGIRVYACGTFGIYFSADSCNTWKPIGNSLPDKSIRAFVVHGDTLIVGTGSGLLIRSTNNGDAWTITYYDTNKPAINALFAKGNSIFAATSAGVLLSTNFGNSWMLVSEELDGYDVVGLFSNSDYVFAATQSNGVWRRPLSELMVTDVDDRAPQHPVTDLLEHNFPDPFVSKTTIEYTLPQREHASLNVFDVMGNLVKTVVNGEEEPGTHHIELSAESLQPGVYFYQLTMKGFTGVKKMVVVR